MRRAFFALFVIASFGCASSKDAMSLVPMPTGMLPASRVSDCLPAAGDLGAYHSLAHVSMGHMDDADVNIFIAGYDYFLKEVDGGPTPIGLHEFFQHPDTLRAQYRDVEDDSYVLVGGRYNVQDQLPAIVSVEFGDDYTDILFGADYFIQPDFAAGLYVRLLGIVDNDFSTVYPHVQWALGIEGGGNLFIEAGLQINGGDGDPDSGIYALLEYYFDRYLSAGMRFSSDDLKDQFMGFVNYRLENGLGFSFEIGDFHDDTMFTVGAEYRF